MERLFLPKLLRIISAFNLCFQGSHNSGLIFRIGHAEPLVVGREDLNGALTLFNHFRYSIWKEALLLRLCHIVPLELIPIALEAVEGLWSEAEEVHAYQLLTCHDLLMV